MHIIDYLLHFAANILHYVLYFASVYVFFGFTFCLIFAFDAKYKIDVKFAFLSRKKCEIIPKYNKLKICSLVQQKWQSHKFYFLCWPVYILC